MLAVPRRESLVQTRARPDGQLGQLHRHLGSLGQCRSSPSSPFLNGKFSVECQNVRRYSLQYQTITNLRQRRDSIYSVRVRGP